LNSIQFRIDSLLIDLEVSLLTEIQDLELKSAKSLLKINIRSAGVIAGVILEDYLLKILKNHSIAPPKKNMTLAEINDVLKQNEIYDNTSWRKVLYLGDIRNICAHKKDVEPTLSQSAELIDGVEWVTKNIF
jgi:hypothetical protein